MEFDVIGDIHGQAGELDGYLTKLGYTKRNPLWIPPHGKQAVFVGYLPSTPLRHASPAHRLAPRRAQLQRGFVHNRSAGFIDGIFRGSCRVGMRAKLNHRMSA